MPTGYTAPVQDGFVTSFREFAIQCARAFGANILMRDDPSDAPIREYEPSKWNLDQLEVAKAALYDAERMTLAEAEVALATHRAKQAKALAQAMETKRVQQERYEAMLTQVQAWTPPTVDHEEMKKFMFDQIEQSIGFDCNDDPTKYYIVMEETPQEWKASLIAKAKHGIEYHSKEWEHEQKRTRERNEWNKALFASLPEK